MIISQSNKFIFIHIPKCGGTAVARMMTPVCTEGDAILGIGGIPFQETTYPTLEKHSKASALSNSLSKAWDEYFIFTFVRNPYSRIVSWYSYAQRKCEEQPFGRKHFRWLYQLLGKPGIWNWDVFRAFLETDSFSEFIRHPNCFGDDGTSPQVNWLSTPDQPGIRGVDYIGRLELIAEDLHHICDRIGIPTPEVERHNASSKRPYQSFYEGPEDIHIVQERYTLDFDLLGYSRTF